MQITMHSLNKVQQIGWVRDSGLLLHRLARKKSFSYRSRQPLSKWTWIGGNDAFRQQPLFVVVSRLFNLKRIIETQCATEERRGVVDWWHALAEMHFHHRWTCGRMHPTMRRWVYGWHRPYPRSERAIMCRVHVQLITRVTNCAMRCDAT